MYSQSIKDVVLLHGIPIYDYIIYVVPYIPFIQFYYIIYVYLIFYLFNLFEKLFNYLYNDAGTGSCAEVARTALSLRTCSAARTCRAHDTVSVLEYESEYEFVN